MRFIDSRPDIVGSLSPCWLPSFWGRLPDTRPRPSWQGFDAEKLAPAMKRLSLQGTVASGGRARYSKPAAFVPPTTIRH